MQNKHLSGFLTWCSMGESWNVMGCRRTAGSSAPNRWFGWSGFPSGAHIGVAWVNLGMPRGVAEQLAPVLQIHGSVALIALWKYLSGFLAEKISGSFCWKFCVAFWGPAWCSMGGSWNTMGCSRTAGSNAPNTRSESISAKTVFGTLEEAVLLHPMELQDPAMLHQAGPQKTRQIFSAGSVQHRQCAAWQARREGSEYSLLRTWGTKMKALHKLLFGGGGGVAPQVGHVYIIKSYLATAGAAATVSRIALHSDTKVRQFLQNVHFFISLIFDDHLQKHYIYRVFCLFHFVFIFCLFVFVQHRKTKTKGATSFRKSHFDISTIWRNTMLAPIDTTWFLSMPAKHYKNRENNETFWASF